MAVDDSSVRKSDPTQLRCAIVVAHPVHLFKLYGWVLRHRPVIHVLTNSAGTGPLGPIHTAALLREFERTGATSGEIFDIVSDAEIYRGLLEGDAGLFTRMTTKIAASFVRHRVELVVADAHEGCSAAHDLCRAISDGAVAIAGSELGRRSESFAC